MKITITYDTLINAIEITAKKLYIGYGMPSNVNEIIGICGCYRGKITFETNIGPIEIDLLDKKHTITKKERKLLKNIQFKDIDLKQEYSVLVSRLKNDTHLILYDISFERECIKNEKVIIATCLSNPKEKGMLTLRSSDNKFMYKGMGMSKENIYRTLLIAERHHNLLLQCIS